MEIDAVSYSYHHISFAHLSCRWFSCYQVTYRMCVGWQKLMSDDYCTEFGLA